MDRERKETQKQRTAGEEPVFNDVVRSDNSRRAGEARFDGFGPLSGQNGPPETARAQLSISSADEVGRSALMDSGC